MAVAEPKHDRGRPKKRTRIVPPPKGQRGPPSVEQNVDAKESMMVPKPKSTPADCSHGKQDEETMQKLCVAKAGGSPLERLRKAGSHGEGSHGGHIIGHTKSGKPIYAAGGHAETRGFSPLTRGFSPQDHNDAMQAHFGAAKKFRQAGMSLDARNSMRAADEHEELRNTLHNKQDWSPAQHKSRADLHEKAARSLLTQGAREKDHSKAQDLKRQGGMHLDLALAHDHLAQPALHSATQAGI